MKKITILLLFFYSVSQAQLELPYAVKNVNNRPIDHWYYNPATLAPWANTAAILANATRIEGQLYYVASGDVYTFKGGILDANLLPISAEKQGLTNDLSFFAGKTLLAVGNSITFGVGASSPPFRWSSQLAARLQMSENNIGASFMDVLFPVSGNAPTVASATNPIPNSCQITFANNHVISAGGYVTLTGFTPATWNGTYQVVSVLSPTSIVFNTLSNPGNATVVGTVTFQNGNSIPAYNSGYGFATIEFGINDLSASSYNKTPEKFRDDLIVLLNDFNSKGWTDDKLVVLSIPGSWFLAYPTSPFRPTIDAANSLTKALCASRNILWVDVTNPFYSGTAPYGWDLTSGQSVYGDDTIHPNDVGYALMSSVVYGAIQGVPFQPIFNARLENVSIANSGVTPLQGSVMLSQNKFGSSTWSNSLTYGSGELKNKQSGAVFTLVDNGLTNPSANAFRIFGNAQNQYGLGVSSESTFVPQIVMDGATGGLKFSGYTSNGTLRTSGSDGSVVVTGLVSNATDASFTATLNATHNILDGVATANRVITIPVGENGDTIKLYNTEDTFIWSFAGETVYLADRVTVVPRLLFNVPCFMERIDGRWIITN